MDEAVQLPSVTVRPIHLDGAADKREEVRRRASEIYKTATDWVTFYREVLGVNGVARRILSEEDFKAFVSGEEFAEIQRMVTELRQRPKPPNHNDSTEPTRVITVRLPKSLHESLRVEADEKKTSMNQLCISKLLQMIENDLIPSE